MKAPKKLIKIATVGVTLLTIAVGRRLLLSLFDQEELVPNTSSISAPVVSKNVPNNFPRILLYVTTHASEEHMNFIDRCWPYIAQKTPLLSLSDILIFSTAKTVSSSQILKSKLEKVFENANKKRHKNVTLHHYNGEQMSKQQGSILALIEAAKQDWFLGYDWIIRINPDVLIYSDAWILDVMTNDESAAGIFVDCWDTNPAKTNSWPKKIHTDFFAVRGDAFPYTPYKYRKVTSEQDTDAEKIASVHFKSIHRAGKDRWLPNTGNHEKKCRVGWKKSGSPVIHNNDFLNECPQL